VISPPEKPWTKLFPSARNTLTTNERFTVTQALTLRRLGHGL